MRLGVVGLMPRDCRDVTEEHTARLRSLHLHGTSCLLPQPDACTREEMERVRRVLADGGITAAQANAQYERLIDPDDGLRKKGIASLQAACRCARWLHAETVYVRPGSMNRAGHWTPHPENTSRATIDRLIGSLKEVAATAEDEGVVLAIEGHTVSTLNTPARVREVIDAVGPDVLKFNMDPVNFVPSIAMAYDNRVLLDDLYDTLGDRTVVAHAKDVRVENPLVVHIAECAPGEGLLDMGHFLRRFEEVCPHGWVLIEHLPDERIPAAAEAMRAAAEQAGLRYEE